MPQLQSRIIKGLSRRIKSNIWREFNDTECHYWFDLAVADVVTKPTEDFTNGEMNM